VAKSNSKGCICIDTNGIAVFLVQATLGGGEDYTLSDLGNLPLSRLEDSHGEQTAQYLMNVARGEEYEPVEETLTSSVKQFSAVVSFGAQGEKALGSANGKPPENLDVLKASSKMAAIANELCHRVKTDLQKNNRYVASCER